MQVAIFSDKPQRRSIRIRCPIYIAMSNYYFQMNLIQFVPIRRLVEDLFMLRFIIMNRSICFIFTFTSGKTY